MKPAVFASLLITAAAVPAIALAQSPELRERLGRAGRATVVERFSIDAQVRRTEAVYDEELLRAGVLRRASHGPPSGEVTPGDRGALEVPPL